MAAIVVMGAACSSDDRTGFGESEPGGSAVATVIANALVYTVDADRSWADAFAFDAAGVIVAVGSEADVLAAVETDPTVVDAGGAMVLPGFQDPHVHVPEAGINAAVCFMPAARTLDDYETLARECAARQSGDGWVRAAGPSLFALRETNELPIDVLDRAVPDRPVVIIDDLGHAAWTNSLGLDAAGIGPEDPDPQGGVFHRDPDTGRLTGLLLEDAQQLVRNAAATDDETNYAGLLVALAELAENGLTSVSDAGGYWAQNHPAAWARALDEGALTVRAANSLYVYPDLEIDEQLAEFERRFSADSDWLRFDTAKVYVDGILDLGTAALLDPYDVALDSRYPSGFDYFQPDDLRTYVSELHAIGYRVNFHAIGDAAVRQALDAVEAVDADPGSIAARNHRITHTYLVHPDDIPRFATIGMIADFQQGPDAIDPDYHEFLFEFIGERGFELIPTGPLVAAGARVSLSSDWDAGPLPPLGTIERVLTRSSNGVSDLDTAIALHTIDAADALGHDDTTGSIEMGKFADFVVLDQNLFDLSPDQIDETLVLATYVGGRAVFVDSDF